MYMGLFVGLALARLFLAELLLVCVDAALQAAKLLCERVGEVDLIERVRRGGADAPAILTTRALMPTTVESGGTSCKTTAFAPMRLLSPTVNGPSTFAPVEISTLLPMVGWRLPVSLPVPPRVTPW